MKIRYMKWKVARESIFFLEGVNREVNPYTVAGLVESITRIGMTIRPVILADLQFEGLRKPGWYIIDGQNLFTALIKMKQDIPFEIMECPTMHDVIREMTAVNSTSRRWTLDNYITAWANVSDDYRLLIKAQHRFKLPSGKPLPMYMIGFAYSLESRTVWQQLIMEGKFVISDLDNGNKILTYLVDLVPMLPKGHLELEREFTMSFSTMYYKTIGTYDHDKFIKHMEGAVPLMKMENSVSQEVYTVFNSFRATH